MRLTQTTSLGQLSTATRQEPLLLRRLQTSKSTRLICRTPNHETSLAQGVNRVCMSCRQRLHIQNYVVVSNTFKLVHLCEKSHVWTAIQWSSLITHARFGLIVIRRMLKNCRQHKSQSKQYENYTIN